LSARKQRQRRYLYEIYSRNTATGLKSPAPLQISPIPFGTPNPTPSRQYDGVWLGQSSGGPWKATLKINSGAATVVVQVVNRLRPGTDHWNDIPAPYNRSPTLTYRWSTSSSSIRTTETGISIDWNEWKSTWEPSRMPYSVLTKVYHQAPSGQFNPISPPNQNWSYTLTGSELVSASWTFRRK